MILAKFLFESGGVYLDCIMPGCSLYLGYEVGSGKKFGNGWATAGIFRSVSDLQS
jgi:hypothetical protein